MPITTQQYLAASGVKPALGLGKEAVFNTLVAPSVYMSFLDSSLDGANKLITRQDIRKSKGMPPPGVGSFEVKGDISTYADANSCGFILANTLGVDTVTAGASGNYIHTMKLAQGLNTLSFQIDKGIGSVYQYTGCKIDTLDLSCKPDSFLEMKFGIVGTTEILSTSPGYLTPVYSSLAPFEWAHLSVSAGGASLLNSVSTPIDDFSISFKNGLKQHWASTGGRFPIAINETLANVTGSMTITYYNDSINQLLWGTSTGPAPGAISQVPLTFTFAQPAVGGVTPTLTFTLPAITVESCVTSIKRSDVLTQAIKFQCNESTLLAQDDLTIVLQNGTSTAYAP